MDVFIGSLMLVPHNFAPAIFALCQGQLLSIASNSALFSLIGTYYGGNGTTNFALPNLQGCVAVGQGQGPGLQAYVLGETGGQAAVNLTTQTTPPHNHGVFATGVSLILNLGSPDQGTYWEVASCAVGGTDYNVTASGTAGLYVAANTQAAGMTNLADYAGSFPNTAFYGTKQVIVNDQEILFLIVTAATNGQTYAANAQVTVWNVAAAGGKVEIGT